MLLHACFLCFDSQKKKYLKNFLNQFFFKKYYF